MSLPISTVNLVLRTASASQKGFGTPVFLTPSLATLNRVSTYTTAPTDHYTSAHNAVKAYNSFKASTPSVTEMKVARVEASLVLTPEVPADGKVYSFIIGNADGETGLCTFTAGASSTAEDVVDNLLADIDSFNSIASEVTSSKVGAGTSATLSLTKTGDFYIRGISGLGETYTATESYTAAYAAAKLEDEDFYFVTAATRDEAACVALGQAVQAESREYFTASNSVDAYNTAYSASSTDLPAQIKNKTLTRTACIYSEDVTDFPECRYVGVNAPFSPDIRAVVWDGRELAGMGVGLNNLGQALNPTQRKNLEDRNCSYVANTSVGARVLGGKMGSGAWIDDIRTQDTIVARVQEGLDTLILNQAGRKLVGGPRGIALVESAIVKALTPFVASDAVEDFSVNTTAASIDQSTRTLSGVSFTVVLAGAILRVVVNGEAINQEV